MNSEPLQELAPSGWLPTTRQETLLRAALLPPEQAEADWLAWCRQVDLENDYIDQGSFRLLPMVYRNLAQHNHSLPEIGRLAGIYRQSWYRNQLILHNCSTLIKQLKEAGIDSLLLKGVPMSLIYYQDMGSRPMGDADILVPGDQIDDAVCLLLNKGWTTNLYGGSVMVKEYFDINHALGFNNKQKIEVDLHARLLPVNYSDALTDDIWRRAIPLTNNAVQFRTLTPEYHLIHACAHGLAWNAIPAIRWVADSVRILSRSRVNWNLLVELSIAHDLHDDIADHLNYLKTTWQQQIPDNVVEHLQQVSSSSAKIKLLQLISRPPSSPLHGVSRLWAYHRYYCHSTGRTNLFYRLWHFPRYLIIKRGLSGYRMLLEWGISKQTVRTVQYFKRALRHVGAS